MFKVRFRDFRCFSDTGEIDVRPITFLVGENNSGKTSFLAGLRFLLEVLTRSTQNPFNRDPYYLGGFEQIARNRGGRGGRAKKFSLEMQVEGDDENPDLIEGIGSNSHSFSFTLGSPQPNLDNYCFRVGDIITRLSFSDEQPKLIIEHIEGKRAPVSVSLRRSPPSALIQESHSYIRFVLDDLRFRSDMNDGVQNKVQTELFNLGIGQKGLESIWRAFRRSNKNLQRNVYATAPVRTQPQRVYTPSEMMASAEGLHVPLEMARAKRRSPEGWKAIRQHLVSFGRSAGLFNDIDIRHLGKSDVDPFQLLVKIDGPAMNLIDVGYGVSQILPIIYQIQSASGNDAFLLQQPEVHLHPRAQAELGSLFAHALARQHKNSIFVIETHSDYLIDRIRIEIKNGLVRPDQVSVIFFDRRKGQPKVANLFFNKNGELERTPRGYRSFFMEEHSRLLGGK